MLENVNMREKMKLSEKSAPEHEVKTNTVENKKLKALLARMFTTTDFDVCLN